MMKKIILYLFLVLSYFTTNDQINVFDMILTPVDQTCAGNGQIVIDITNTEAGAEFEFQIYQLPNISTTFRVTNGIIASGNTLSHIETSLPVGNFRITATQ